MALAARGAINVKGYYYYLMLTIAIAQRIQTKPAEPREHQEEISKGFYFKHMSLKQSVKSAKNTALSLFVFFCVHDLLWKLPINALEFLSLIKNN